MREIKVRGYAVEQMVKSQWLFGFGVSKCELTNGTSEVILYTDSSPIEVHEKSVGQYTGLKDKNGREIYEGDILETVYQYKDKRQVRRTKVEVDTVNPCMVLENVRNKNDVEYDFVQCGLMSHTILGNIHENPELLGDIK